ncbi:hypothetical protein CesoFtcFv8_015683 [Champsocephalus esox]|uniref:M-phase-specific PLK1-interacting protein n=2 Tax=Champsocephalus TaxID=52236 RepID=A0AAN8HLG6_CHAGU|nr:hypothetical protein CesoFtcFv8_015683 [Champsocephalus esox]KAK5920241.1 hypothetical protein CgunFtcFv8_024076 [Champsocephalus gunnari]
MHRAPDRPPPSPGAPRPAACFPSPASSWSGAPYGAPPRPQYSPFSPGYTDSPGSYRGNRDSPGSYRGNRDSPGSYRGNRDSPGSYRGFGSRSRGGGFRRPQGFSPAQNHQGDSVERYFSPSMLQDPWAALLTDRKLQTNNN